MLINLSNHPSVNWGKQQTDTSIAAYGNISDITFPQINPEWGTDQIMRLTETYYGKITDLLKQNYSKNEKNAVHIMGELTFVYHLVKQLKSSGINCVASTSNRIVEEKGGKKIVVFEFVKFREY